ncbi:hypothetical protein K7I13_07435 [Brucepastera parasyntrophica]|uniref:hypothetical protein n=1 Tax=Brucepastera parasyntrophica TaxID=2880008 RepID=UPI00210A50D5|nr:hypothetical protein [Brucepastera parasyntrophica]ULQ61076.1 hypothetical protein K7I13_07435 [Brucepastera parasyntrophica]
MFRKHTVLPVFFSICFVLVCAGCTTVQDKAADGVRDGVRDGVMEGISGLFGGSKTTSASGTNSTASSVSTNTGGTSTAPERNYSGASQTVPWPSDTEWARYGLSGLRQPSGTSVTGAALYMGNYIVGLINGGKPAFDDLVSQIEKMSGAELMTNMTMSDGQYVGYQLSGGSVQITVDYIEGDITITATK